MSRVEMMEFPYGSFLEVRLEFVLLRDDELQAKIMRIIEWKMTQQKQAWLEECVQAASDGKPEPPEPEYYVTLSYAQIIAQLFMFNSSRKGDDKGVVEGKKNSIHRNTITKVMTALIDDKYVITRPNPNKTKEYEATQYTLNLPLIQEHMRLLPKNPMSYLGSNGRIDGVPCPDFSNPPKEIPCTKFVHGSGDAQKDDTPCTKNVHPLHGKSASPSTKNVQGDAQKSSHLIDRGIDKEIDSQIEERKNDVSQQNSHVSIQDDSFFPPSLQSSLSVDLLPEVRRTYDLICQELYPNCPPNLTIKAIEHFTKLATGIKTVEDIHSLVAYCRQEQPILNTSKIHPGNLVRWLDGWLLQVQPQEGPEVSPEVGDPVVTDEELADDVWKFVQAYQDEERFEEHLSRIDTIKQQMRVSNYNICDRMANAYRRCLSTESSTDDFVECLRLSFH